MEEESARASMPSSPNETDSGPQPPAITTAAEKDIPTTRSCAVSVCDTQSSIFGNGHDQISPRQRPVPTGDGKDGQNVTEAQHKDFFNLMDVDAGPETEASVDGGHALTKHESVPCRNTGTSKDEEKDRGSAVKDHTANLAEPVAISITTSDSRKRPRSPMDYDTDTLQKMPKNERNDSDPVRESNISLNNTDGSQSISKEKDGESADLSTKQAPKSSILRPDLLAAILGSAPPAISVPIVVPAPVVNENPPPEPKPKRKPPTLIKMMKAKKDIKDAKVLLGGKIDLATILPEQDCRFLAEKLWIVSKEQLQNVLQPKSEECSVLRQELIDSLAASSLVSTKAGSLGPDRICAGHDEGEGKRSQTNGDTSLPKDSNQASLSMDQKVDDSFVDNEKEESGSLQLAMDSEVHVSPCQHSQVPAEQVVPTIACGSDVPERALSVSDHRSEKKGEEQQTPEKLDGPQTPAKFRPAVVYTASSSKSSYIYVPIQPRTEVVVKDLVTEKVVVKDLVTEKVEITASDKAEATRIMESWSKKLKGHKIEFHPDDISKNFLLDGPISFLFPKCTQNFLKSIGISTAFDFMCHKKTESGLLVDVYEEWRKACKLAKKPRVVVAKHLVALGLKLEVLIGSICPPATKERRWIAGHTAVLSAAAKDFLFDIGIVDGPLFVDTMTKKLSDRFESWRETKGLPPLKGTGKVAMISSWKTQIREAQELEGEDGQILDASWKQSLKILADADEQLKKFQGANKKTLSRSLGKAQVKPKSEFEAFNQAKAKLLKNRIGSPKLDLGNTFEKVVVETLASLGISSFDQLLSLDATPESTVITKYIEAQGGGIVEQDARAFCDKVQSWQKIARAVAGRGDRKQNQNDTVGSMVDSTGDKEVSRPRSKAFSRKDYSTPWDALSDTTKEFLLSVNISDAEAFLASKTRDLADLLVIHRQRSNLPPLKGTGSVASVSAWKSIVRNAAKEMGQDELVTLNAGRNAGKKLKPRKKRAPDNDGIDKVPALQLEQPSRKPSRKLQNASFTKRKRESETKTIFQEARNVSIDKFSVSSDKIIFSFDLTLRQNFGESPGLSYYLTYLGSGGASNHVNRDNGLRITGDDIKVLEPLDSSMESNDGPIPFCSAETGLIELGKYGVKPKQKADKVSTIRNLTKAFIMQDEATGREDQASTYFNMFEHIGSSEVETFFYSKTVLEKGQTIKLTFPSDSRSMDDGERRHYISLLLGSLQMTELVGLLEFIDNEIGKEIYVLFETVFRTKVQQGSTEATIVGEKADRVTRLAVARRRMHWIALQIESAFKRTLSQKGGNIKTMPPVVTKPLWKEDMISAMSTHPLWEKCILPSVLEESKKEIHAEFNSTLGNFLTSKHIWCPTAISTFDAAFLLLQQSIIKLGSCLSDENLVKELASLIQKGVLNFEKNWSPELPRDMLGPFLLDFDGSKEHSSNMFPSTHVLRSLLCRKYFDGMALASDPPLLTRYALKEKFVAIKRSPSSDGRNVTTYPEFRSIHDFDLSDTIDLDWYVRVQVVAVVDLLALCAGGLLLRGSEKVSDISSRTLDRASFLLGGRELVAINLRQGAYKRKLTIPAEMINTPAIECGQPESRSVFLCIVWPKLASLNWKLEAGIMASSLSYIMPGLEDEKRARVLKQEAAAVRGNVARKTTELGLGGIPKEIKRLFVACAGNSSSDPGMSRSATVAKALESFAGSLSIPADTTNQIIQHFLDLFETIAPSLVNDCEETGNSVPTTLWQDHLKCEYLVQFLFVLPKMMCHSDANPRQIERITGITTDLLQYLATNRNQLLDESLQYPHEECANDFAYVKYLEESVARLNSNDRIDGKSPGEEPIVSDMKEIVLPTDRTELTDFVATVMDQVIVCRANENDLKIKGRRSSFLELGAPGLMCKYCLGQSGEGKYFYSNKESLATASTSIDKHLLKCQMVSQDLKERILEAKKKNVEQRLQAPSGAQSAFFARLWHRLQQVRSNSTGVAGDMYVAVSALNATAGATREDDLDLQSDATTFNSHIDVLRFIQEEEPWIRNSVLQEAVAEYYDCLSRGSDILGTPAAPKNYSTEWVMAKLGYTS